MKKRTIYLLKDIEKVGIAGEILNVKAGYATFLTSKNMGIELTRKNRAFYEQKAKTVENRAQAIESETSMRAEHIKSLKLTVKRKTHDDGKLFGSISPAEVVDALAKHDVKISKSQVIFDKSIKETGEHTVTIKLSSRLQPQVTLKVSSE